MATDNPRPIGLLRATAMVAGIIIGASIFVQPSEITRRVPSVSGMLLVWLLAGVLTLFGALICAELASAFPRTGGVYVFLRETFHPAAGFLWGWAMFWCMHSGIVAAIAVVTARYIGFFIPLSGSGTRTDHILAGSDYPHLIGSLRRMLDSIAELDISDADRAAILGGNTARLLVRD